MVKIYGINNLLSGFYKEIVIVEEKGTGDFRVRVNPDEKFKVTKLDKSYNHLNLKGLSDIEKIKAIINYYLNNNGIFTITNYSKRRGDSGTFSSLNANISYLDDYSKNYGRALYFRLYNSELEEDLKNMQLKYKEDRVRRMNDILECKKIYVDSSSINSMAYIEDDTAYITVRGEKVYNFKINPNEEKFLNDLLLSFMNNYGLNMDYDGNRIKICSLDKSKCIDADFKNLYDSIVKTKCSYLESKEENINQLTLTLQK